MSTVRIPAGPKGRLLGGHFAHLARDPLAFLTRCAREYGDFVPLRVGPRRMFFLNHPSYIESVLVTNRRHFIKGPVVRSAGRLYGRNGLFLAEGDRWQQQRWVAQPAFHPQWVASNADAMVARGERMLAGWHDGETRDVQHDMMRLMLEIVGDALFGADLSAPGDAFVDALMVALGGIATRVQSLAFLLPETVPTSNNRRLLQAIERLDAVVADIIAKRTRDGGDRGDLLSMLMREDMAPPAAPAAPRQLRDEVMSFLLAGLEASAVALAWTWHLLAGHPLVEHRLAAELDGVLKGQPPAAADVPHLRYTNSILLESMRLYPPVALLGRQAVHDCEVGAFRVRRGELVVASQWVMHRDARYFENPDVFDPDRWTDGLLDTLPRYVYFPFGGGPRVCIGRSFAMMELTLLLATIARAVRLTRVADHPVVLLPTSSLFAKHGLKMRVHHRFSRSRT